MSQDEAVAKYYKYADKVGDLVRQISFAGFAVIWIFRANVQGKQVISTSSLIAASCFTLSLAIDFVHHFWGAARWYERSKPTAKAISSGVDPLTFWFIQFKSFTLVIGIGCLLWFLCTHIYYSHQL
jgi:hypothetical protein